MSPRTPFEVGGDASVCVSCFSFRRKKPKKSAPLAVDLAAAELRSFVSAPDCSELSVASSSVSCVAVGPEVDPLHLDIPYVAASPLSHTNTLASIERYNTPRASYGPVSDAGRAIVAARKDSMRQEHLAAIAHLNTFAKKRASKPPSLQSDSDSGQASRQDTAGVLPASSTGAQRHISAIHQMPKPAALAAPAASAGAPPIMAGKPLSAEPAFPDDSLALHPAALAADSNPYLSSGSMYGDGDWLAGGINSHRNSNCSPSVSSHRASHSLQTDNTAGQQNILPVGVSSKPILGDSCQPDAPGAHHIDIDMQPADTNLAGYASQAQVGGSNGMQLEAKHQPVNLTSSGAADRVNQADTQFRTVQQHAHEALPQDVDLQQQQVGGTLDADRWQSGANQHTAVTAQPRLGQAVPASAQSQLPARGQESGDAGSRRVPGLHPMTDSRKSSAVDRLVRAQTSLDSRESSPDESLVAEGWIVAGTIMMSNRTNGTSTLGSARGNSSAINVASGVRTLPSAGSTSSSKVASSVEQVSTTQSLSQQEVTALSEELEVLKQKPRSQMVLLAMYSRSLLQTSAELAHYLDIKIKLARAGGLSCRSSTSRISDKVDQVAKPTESRVLKDRPLNAKQSPRSSNLGNPSNKVPVHKPAISATRQSMSRGLDQENKSRRPSVPSGNVPRSTQAISAKPRRGAGSRPTADACGQHVPAYMKATASNKAKDAREAQAKIAASRSALTEKKWNRA